MIRAASSSASATEPPAPEESLVDALVQASFVTMALLTKIAAEHDLSLTQLRVLAILRDRRLRMTELADYLGLEKSTMSGLVARAEQRELVARGPSAEDGRVVQVSITPAGARLAARGYDEVARALGSMLTGLSAADQGRLGVLLGRMLGPAAETTRDSLEG